MPAQCNHDSNCVVQTGCTKQHCVSVHKLPLSVYFRTTVPPSCSPAKHAFDRKIQARGFPGRVCTNESMASIISARSKKCLKTLACAMVHYVQKVMSNEGGKIMALFQRKKPHQISSKRKVIICKPSKRSTFITSLRTNHLLQKMYRFCTSDQQEATLVIHSFTVLLLQSLSQYGIVRVF